MPTTQQHTSTKRSAASLLFVLAGCFMLINTISLWVRYFSDFQLSILWPAIPAIVSLALGLCGLLKLYPRLILDNLIAAKIGAAFALLALFSLSLAAVWIFSASLFGEGIPEQTPKAVLVLIAIFMLAMVLAFLSNAIGFSLVNGQRSIGYLLFVPVAMWGLMLIVGSVRGMEVGLSLDYYTNAVICASFVALSRVIRHRC